MWVEDLEKKSKDITVVNHNLHQEVIMLRSEVQQLKSILVAHKDCPLIVHQVPGGKGMIVHVYWCRHCVLYCVRDVPTWLVVVGA